jgi:Replication-relaxation
MLLMMQQELAFFPRGYEPMQQQPTRTAKPRREKTAPFTITGQLDRILQEAIYPYHFLTAPQITRALGYRKGTTTTVQERLKALTDNKYLHSFFLPLAQRQRPFVYCLGLQGKKYLEKQGLDLEVYYEPNQGEQRTYWFLMHTLELNDVLIAAATLEKSAPDVHLFDFRHDFTLKRDPVIALSKQGKQLHIVPDSFLDFRHTLTQDEGIQKTRRYCFLVELDRGTHSDKRFMQKLQDYLTSFEQEKLAAHFQTKRLTILFVTTAGARRVEKMRELARKVLKGVSKDSFTNQMFKFASVPPLMEAPLDPTTIFCSPFWTTAYGEPTERQALMTL